MKGDFRPLIRPDISDELGRRAGNKIDKTVLTNMLLELALAGNFVMEIESKNPKIKMADGNSLIPTSRMRKEVL